MVSFAIVPMKNTSLMEPIYMKLLRLFNYKVWPIEDSELVKKWSSCLCSKSRQFFPYTKYFQYLLHLLSILNIKKNITDTLNKLVVLIVQLNKLSKEEMDEAYTINKEDQAIIKRFVEKYNLQNKT